MTRMRHRARNRRAFYIALPILIGLSIIILSCTVRIATKQWSYFLEIHHGTFLVMYRPSGMSFVGSRGLKLDIGWSTTIRLRTTPHLFVQIPLVVPIACCNMCILLLQVVNRRRCWIDECRACGYNKVGLVRCPECGLAD